MVLLHTATVPSLENWTDESWLQNVTFPLFKIRPLKRLHILRSQLHLICSQRRMRSQGVRSQDFLGELRRRGAARTEFVTGGAAELIWNLFDWSLKPCLSKKEQGRGVTLWEDLKIKNSILKKGYFNSFAKELGET